MLPFRYPASTPAGFSMIGFLIEGDELIFDHWHTFPQIRCTFAPHLILCHDTYSGKAVMDDGTLPAELNNQGDRSECREAAIKRPVNAMLRVTEIAQERYAQDIEAGNSEAEIGAQHLH